jgi:GGDEF domain-containing protein
VAAAAAGEVVCLLRLTAPEGAATDEPLRAFGALLRSVVRVGEFSGRYGEREFALVLADVPVETVVVRLRRLATRWHRRHRAGHAGEPRLRVAAGVAVVDERGADVAVRAAGAALDRAGTGQVATAAAVDYGAMGER